MTEPAEWIGMDRIMMNFRNIPDVLATLALLAMLFSGCTKQSLETSYNNQETKIDNYISALVTKDSIRVVHNAGAHRAVLVEGEGEPLSNKGSVAFYYAGYVFNGNISSSNLFATNHEPTATSSSFNAPGFPLEVRIEDMSDSQLLKGLYNGLVGVQAGEECVILFSGKYGFGKKAVGTIPANSALAYHIWVESINND